MTEYTASQKRKYLADVLRMNPVQQSAQIIKLRNQLFGKSPHQTRIRPDSSIVVRQREKAASQIDEIREQMYRQSPENLEAMLNAVDVCQLAEMKPVLDRMRLVIQNLFAVQELPKIKSQHINFVNTFKRVIVSPPRESGMIKEAYLRQIVESPELKRIKRSVNNLQNEYPQLFAMEPDWLLQIQSMKGRKRTYTGQQLVLSESESSIPGWLIWVLIVIVFRVLTFILKDS